MMYNDNNMIPRPIIENMKKYATANFQKDMKEEGYEGEVQPNISGFIQKEIEDYCV